MLSDDEPYDLYSDSSDASPRGGHAGAGATVLDDPEVWQDYWSEELVTLWHGLRDHAAAMGVEIDVLGSADLHAFAHFCWAHCSRRPPVA